MTFNVTDNQYGRLS